MSLKAKFSIKGEQREYFKLQVQGILLGVVLIIVMQALSDIFETHAFFGMSIMLLAVIVANLSYLTGLGIKQEKEKRGDN